MAEEKKEDQDSRADRFTYTEKDNLIITKGKYTPEQIRAMLAKISGQAGSKGDGK